MSRVVLEGVDRAPRAVREKVGQGLRKGYLMIDLVSLWEITYARGSKGPDGWR
jgi:hypothetical protein